MTPLTKTDTGIGLPVECQYLKTCDLHAVLLSPNVKKSDEVMRLWEARFLLKVWNLVYILKKEIS